MPNTVQLTKNGQPVYPVTDVSLITGLEERSGMRVIPYSTQPTASADTVGFIYMDEDTQDLYVTKATSGSYTWVSAGNLSDIDLDDYATKNELNQLGQKVTINKAYCAPFDEIETFPGAIISTGDYRNQDGYTCRVIPVSSGQTIEIQGSATAYWGLVKSYSTPTATGDSTPDYATGESVRTLTTSVSTVTVPSDAKYAIIPVLSNNNEREPSLLTIDSYDLIKGAIKNIVEISKFSSGQLVKETSIIDNLNGGAENILSAEQGKVLNIQKQDKEHIVITKEVAISSAQQIIYEDTKNFGKDVRIELLDWSFPQGTATTVRISYKVGNTIQTALYLGSDAKRADLHSNTDDISYIKIYIQDNITAIQSATVSLLYGDAYLNTVTSERVGDAVMIKTTKSSSTSDSVELFTSSQIFIKKGEEVIFELPEVGTVISEYRLYINQTSTYVAVKSKEYNYAAEDDCYIKRISTASGKTLLSGEDLNLKVYIKGLEKNVSAIDNDFASLSNTVSTLLLDLSKQAFIDANPSGYDSTNNKFTAGTYLVELAPANNTVALMDIITNYVAKYTSTGDNYPYIQMRYYYGSEWDNWWKYPIGGKGFYKSNQCKLVCPGTDTFSSPWNANIQIRIVVPSGCELFIKNINAEYSNSLINKNSFKVYQHGTERGTTGADNRTNWDLWTHIGNYGAIVIPKRTTDGKWVCYHDDEFGSNPKVQIIGDPTASLPAASMQACTYAQTQTLEYKATNFYGDHDTIPLLSEFFAKCAQMGVHPALSCHPIHISEAEGSTWKYADWAEVKALAKKYRVLDKLTIKSAYGLDAVQTFYNIFGNDIESYIADVIADPTQATIEELAGIGWDLNKVKVGFELVVTDAYFSDATIAAIEAANLIHGIAPGSGSILYREAKFLKSIIDKGCWEITADQFYSNGLNWA